MYSFGTHLTALEAAASKYASRPAFKVPRIDPQTGGVQEWESISYAQFKNDVELFAKYWAHTLGAQGLPERSVVGVWLGGTTYNDALHIYGISRANYIPQLFSLRLPSAEVIFELLQKANAKALVYDSSYQSLLGDSPVPVYLALNAKESGTVYGHLPDMPEVANRDGTVFIFHTSGSTSGSPKLVPWSYSWQSFCMYSCGKVFGQPHAGKTITRPWIGSMCHSGQHFIMMGAIPFGFCIIQPTKIAFSPDELEDMVVRCGLNQLAIMPTFFISHLNRARQDAKFLALLRGLDEVFYGGLALPRGDEDWAYENGITLKNLFGSTECGPMLASVGGLDANRRLLRPADGISYEFRPVVPEANSESGHQSGTRLLEFVILKDSLNCPHRSFCDEDGNFHTGDLFEEVIPGYFANRGRDDDWIKSENALRCDTRAIEDNVRITCADMIGDCVVVGYGRPSPVLLVEAPIDVDQEVLKKKIIQATRPFNSRRYMHERISSEKMIIVVPPKTLPRTSAKDNIRRRAVEEAYKSQLDEIYSSA